MDNPGEVERLRADRSLIKPFVNEAIRWTAPVKHFFRNVAQDYELNGTMLRRGDHVMLSYGAATRDEVAFEQANQFRLDRGANNHLAFGYGPHMCLGQFLAKLEIEAFFNALLDKVETIEMTGPVLYTEAPFVSGIKSLPVRYRLKGSD
jgi:cytochrome P450